MNSCHAQHLTTEKRTVVIEDDQQSADDVLGSDGD